MVVLVFVRMPLLIQPRLTFSREEGAVKNMLFLPCAVPPRAYHLFLQQKQINPPPDPLFAILTPVVDPAPCALDGTFYIFTTYRRLQLQHGSMWCVEWDPLTPSRLATGPSSCSPVSIFDLEHQRLTAVAKVGQAGRKRSRLFPVNVFFATCVQWTA